MKTLHIFLLSLPLFLLSFFSLSSAEVNLPTQLINSSVMPACLSVTADFVRDSTWSKLAVVKIDNSCPSDVSVDTIRHSKIEAELEKSTPEIGVILAKKKADEEKPFLFVSNPDDCKPLMPKQKAWREEEERRKDAKRARPEPKNSEERRQRIREELSQDRSDQIYGFDIACNNLQIPIDSKLMVLMPWDTYYIISGNLGKTPVQISGKMINPRPVDPNEVVLPPVQEVE